MHEHKRNDTLTMSKTGKLNETVSTDSMTGLALLSLTALFLSETSTPHVFGDALCTQTAATQLAASIVAPKCCL